MKNDEYTEAEEKLFASQVRDVTEGLASLLIEKNKAYGDSALDPVRIFSDASPVEQLLVRIDDKLSRLKRGRAAGEDVELDLMGYLVLLRIARARAEQTEMRERTGRAAGPTHVGGLTEAQYRAK